MPYVIALKRESRNNAPADWVKRVRAVPGVQLVGPENDLVIRVDATPDGLEQLRAKFGTFCNIEPTIHHKPSTKR